VVEARNRGGILTGEFPYSRARALRTASQGPVTARVFAAPLATPDLARLLRKHSSNEARSNGSQPKHTEGATMIAATAFAVVGLVVVAFLNRIP
jgi:hypothetical protein